MSGLGDACADVRILIASHLPIQHLVSLMLTNKENYINLKAILITKLEELLKKLDAYAKFYKSSDGDLQFQTCTYNYNIDLSSLPNGVATEQPSGNAIPLTKENVVDLTNRAITSISQTLELINTNLQNIPGVEQNEIRIWESHQEKFKLLSKEFGNLKDKITGGKKTCYLYKGTRYTKVHTVNKKKCIYSKKEDTYVPISSKSVKKV